MQLPGLEEPNLMFASKRAGDELRCPPLMPVPDWEWWASDCHAVHIKLLFLTHYTDLGVCSCSISSVLLIPHHPAARCSGVLGNLPDLCSLETGDFGRAVMLLFVLHPSIPRARDLCFLRQR